MVRFRLSSSFVMAWTRSPDQDITEDRRGWKKSKPRTYTPREEQRVLVIHRDLDSVPAEFFAGAPAIERRYRERYPKAKPLSLRYIGRTLAKHRLASKPNVQRKGDSRYLHYPEHLVNALSQQPA